MCHFMTVFLHDVLAKRSEIYGKKLDFFVKKKKKKQLANSNLESK